MKLFMLFFLFLCPAVLHAQSRTVLPQELSLQVQVETTDHVPQVGEMVLLTIRGVYRRHITREVIVQPDLEGFNWTQLGPDVWRDDRLDGQKVKTFTRRMAIYPNRAGTLQLGAFTHNLTLTDEIDAWFEYPVRSSPVTIDVAPAPGGDDWWFPVKSLKISDQWSNAPDQLAPGEGVLRIIRVEALGVTPEMIPPMPELKSPSAMIFPHPDKRFVELSPDGPLSYAFWRWTIRPTNDTSAIVEPLGFEYFDTTTRQTHSVTISAQRVAYGSVVPEGNGISGKVDFPSPTRLPGWPLTVMAGVICALGAGFSVAGRRLSGLSALRRFRAFDPLARQLKQAARAGDVVLLRRAATAILRREGASDIRLLLLSELDRSVFAVSKGNPSLGNFAERFLRAG